MLRSTKQKKVLAYEVTKLVHGEAEAEKAQQAAEALFGGGGALTDVPTIEITAADAEGKIIDVLTAGKIFSSKREARQMIQQGGLILAKIQCPILRQALRLQCLMQKKACLSVRVKRSISASSFQ